jgi:integrase
LKAIMDTWLGELDDSALTSQKLVEFAQWRMSKEGGGVQAQTVGNDLSHLGAVLSVARPAWGYEVDALAMPDARKVLRKLGMVSKSKERNRRPTLDELDKLMDHFFEMQTRRKAQIDMPKMIAFAIFSTRRQEEITRIRWEDLGETRQAVLVRDMKNPRQKIGNNVWCHLPDEAWGSCSPCLRRKWRSFRTTRSQCRRRSRGPVRCWGSKICISMTCGTKG